MSLDAAQDSLKAPSFTGSGRSPHLQRTLRASGWMYSSRAMVFVWAVLLTQHFGIANYGLYAMAFAVGAVIGVPLDSYFTIRGPRVSHAVFLGERSTRVLLGLCLLLAGIAWWPLSFGLGFAVVKAGSDVVFQASSSSLVRSGHPDRVQRADAFRQLTGVAFGAIYLLIADQPSLSVAAALYLAGSALPNLVAISALSHARPLVPEVSGRSAIILGESIGAVAYVHAEVILLGVFGTTASAGYYSFGATILWSLAALGQSFGHTYHQPLRDSRGDISAGPRLSTALWLSGATAGLIAGSSALLWWLGAPAALWVTFAVLAPVSFLRTLSSVSTVVLSMQHRDHFRLGVTMVSVAIKVGLVLQLQHLGGPGAALAFLVSDAIMSGAYTQAVYGRKGLTRTVPSV